jgi:hypothetical protein
VQPTAAARTTSESSFIAAKSLPRTSRGTGEPGQAKFHKRGRAPREVRKLPCQRAWRRSPHGIVIEGSGVVG